MSPTPQPTSSASSSAGIAKVLLDEPHELVGLRAGEEVVVGARERDRVVELIRVPVSELVVVGQALYVNGRSSTSSRNRGAFSSRSEAVSSMSGHSIPTSGSSYLKPASAEGS